MSAPKVVLLLLLYSNGKECARYTRSKVPYEHIADELISKVLYWFLGTDFLCALMSGRTACVF